MPFRETSMSERIATGLLCLLALLILSSLAVIYLQFEHPYGAEQIMALSDGWIYQTDSQPEPARVEDLRQYIPLKPDETLVLRRDLKEEIEQAALLVDSSYHWMRVYLDGRLLLDNRSGAPGSNPGLAVYYLPLPEDYAGKELRIEASSPYPYYAYSPDPPRLGSAKALRAYTMDSSVKDALLAFILMANGVVFLLFSLTLTIQRPQRIRWDNFAFGVFSILLGLTYLGTYGVTMQIFSPVTAGNVDMVLWVLFPFPLIVSLVSQFTRCKRPMGILLVLHLVSAVAAFSLALAGIWDLPMSLAFLNPVYIFLTVAATVMIVLEWIGKNKPIRFISPGFVLLLLSAVLSAINIGGFYVWKEWLRTMGLLSLIALTWVYYLKEYIVQRKEEQKNMHVLEVKRSLAVKNLEAANQYIRETGIMRHEINHHLTALQSLSGENDAEGIACYLSKLVEAVSETEIARYCENTLVNSILLKYAVDCKGEVIHFRCEASVSKEVPFADNDLCVLLMNLLDNALEASRKLPEDQRWIRLQIYKKDNFLVISCENAWDGSTLRQEGWAFSTTKPDKRVHGFGIPAMQEIAQKYESRINIHTEETCFSVKTALRFPEASL